MSKPTLLSLASDYHREENLDPGDLLNETKKLGGTEESLTVITPVVEDIEKKEVESQLQSTPDTEFELKAEAKTSDTSEVSSYTFVEEGEEALESTPLQSNVSLSNSIFVCLCMCVCMNTFCS